MPTTDGSVIINKNDTTDYNDPLYIHPSDNSVTTITIVKLIGTENFRLWRAAMTRALKGRNKLGFVDGTITRPVLPAISVSSESKNLKIQKWERANAVVCYWLLGSISESICPSHMHSETAKEIWDDISETYNKSDGSVVFNLHQNFNSVSQNGNSLYEYFTKLDSLWKDFDGLINLTECKCESATKLNDHAKLMKLMQFLSGLDESYNQVKSHILLMEPLPDVKTAYSILSREESFQKGSVSTSGTKPSNSAFNSKFNNKLNSTNKNRNQSNQSLQCKNCGIKGHTIDRCYKLIGYPKDFKPRNDFSSNQSRNYNANNSSITPTGSSSTSDNSGNGEAHFLTSDQYSKFLQLLEKQTVEESAATANMAGTSTFTACTPSVYCYSTTNSSVNN